MVSIDRSNGIGRTERCDRINRIDTIGLDRINRIDRMGGGYLLAEMTILMFLLERVCAKVD